MEETVEISTGQMAIGHAPQILITRGIGSCIALGLYARSRQIGALLHILLPTADVDLHHPLRFADTAIPKALAEFHKVGVADSDLSAYMTGGAAMFQSLTDLTAIGSRNVDAVCEQLRLARIPIENKEVGGNLGRNVHFDLSTGEFMISYN